MWGFQGHFRSGVEYETQEVLSHIGLRTNDKVKVLLIGFATEDDLPHQICIEPENGLLVVDDLRLVRKRTEEILQADPEFRVVHTNSRVNEDRSRGLFLRSRAHAIAEAIQESGKFEGLSFFVCNSTPVKSYDVHTCVGIPCEALESVPSFKNPKKAGYHERHIEESFVQAIVNTCLDKADKALYLPNPGADLNALGDRIDIVRSSAQRFVGGVVFGLTPLPQDLFRLANEVSSLTYERSGARGHLVVTISDNLSNKLKVSFQVPVRLNETRSVRKLLELTDETKALLTDGVYVYGLEIRTETPCWEEGFGQCGRREQNEGPNLPEPRGAAIGGGVAHASG